MNHSATAKQKQPAGLYLLFATEMWERFSYYSLRGLFVLYLIDSLAFTQPDAMKLYGKFTSLIYLSPLLGGYIADRWWGKRKAIIMGAILIAIGQFVMGIHSVTFMYTALGLIIMGNGLFKPNISSIVGELYQQNDPRRDGGFTLFYMGINLGSFIANLIAGTLGEKIGWHWGFWTAGVGMILGLSIFLWGKDKYIRGLGMNPAVKIQSDSCEREAGVKDSITINSVKKDSVEKGRKKKEPLTKEEWQKMGVIFIMAFFSIFFWTLFEQKGAALNIFAKDHVNRVIHFFGLFTWEMPATWCQSFNPLFIILFAPVASKLWTSLAAKDKEPSIPVKFMIAYWLIAIGYVILLIAAMQMGPGIKVGLAYLAFAYFFFTMGELCLSPVGLSMVSKLAPVQFVSLLMGVWFLCSAAANYLAGYYSSLFGVIDDKEFFSWLIITPVVASFLLMFLIPKLKRWMHDVK